MKNLFLSIGMMCCLGIQAQFSIHGELINYPNKPVFIKFYENGNQRLLTKKTTDAKGNFTYDFPYAYTGKVIFELTQGSFDVIVDNHDTAFTTDIKDDTHKINYDGVHRKVNSYFDVQDKKYLADNTLSELLQLYNPDDAFYENLLLEIDRINKLETPNFTQEGIQYYVKTKDKIAQLNANTYKDQVAEISKNHLINDNFYIENFGLIPEFLNLFISNSLGVAASREEASQNISKAIDGLLEDVGTDTARGQSILSYIITMFDTNGFTDLTEKYVSQAESLTCEITDDLSALIKGKNNLRIGVQVPDFSFENKVKGINSLYDIQADKKLIVFWASWCPHCMGELPHIKEFYKDFKKHGGEIIAISLDMEEPKYQKAVSDTQWINFSDFLKWESPLVKQFGITSTPTMILLDKDNKVVKTGSRITEFIE